MGYFGLGMLAIYIPWKAPDSVSENIFQFIIGVQGHHHHHHQVLVYSIRTILKSAFKWIQYPVENGGLYVSISVH